jgi:hypothetical protein
MLAFAKTMESPCRNCEYIHHDKDECAKNCDRLSTFQAAILRHDEINIKNFQVRPQPARKAV